MTTNVTTTVAEMSTAEFKQMIETIIEQKLLELFGDPDEGLVINESLRKRLFRQRQAIAQGEQGQPFQDVIQKLKLD